MEGSSNIKDIIAARWVDAAPDVQATIALRAVFRTLPLLMLYSETLRKTSTPVAPFGFLPEDNRKAHLLSLLQTYSLAALQVQRKLPLESYSLANYHLFNSIFQIYSSGLEFASHVRYKTQIAFYSDSPQTKDLLSSNNLVCSILESTACLLYPLEREFSELVPELESAVQVAELAAEASALYSEAAVLARQFVAMGDYTSATVAAAIAHSLHLEGGFAYYAEAISAVATNLGQPPALVNFVDAAKTAAVAFTAVLRELEAGNLAGFSAALATAMTAAASYEVARVATLPFYEHIEFDIYLEPDSRIYESVQIVHREDFALAAAAAFRQVATAAARAADSIAAAAQDRSGYDAARYDADVFRSACDAIDPHLAHAAKAFNETLICSARLVLAFSAYEGALRWSQRWREEYITGDAYWRTEGAILEALAAHSEHNLRDLNESFIQSLMEDLKFIDQFSCSELRTREIWLPAEVNGYSSPELCRRYVGIAIWKELWVIFKREALAIEPGTQLWLDWCDDLFAGNSRYMTNLEAVLKSPCTPQFSNKATSNALAELV